MSENEKEKSDWPPLILLFIGLPVAFTYGGLWIGLLVLVVSVVTLGWSKHHEGPFLTHMSCPRMAKSTTRSLLCFFPPVICSIR